MLSHAHWRAYTIRLVHLPLDPGEEISEELKSKADYLVKVLSRRFKSFLKRKIPTQNKREHWSMQLAYANLPVDACLMAMSGHLPDALEFLNDSDCLISNDLSRYVKCKEHPDREGGYLHFDGICTFFVRSGKNVGRGFDVRNGEHLKEAKKPIPSSKFYRRWPSRESSRAGNKGIKGHFECLTQVIAAGFDNDAEELQYLNRDWKEGGLLILSENHSKHINDSMKHLNYSSLIKHRHILGYTIELGYNLVLAPDNDESDSAGYEAVLGVFSSLLN